MALLALLKTSTGITEAKKLLLKEMEEELTGLTSTKEPSVLRQSRHDLLPSFKMANFVEELKAKAPLTTELLNTLSVSKAKKRKQKNGEQVNTVIPTIAAIILQNRCPQMSALAYRIGLILRFSGAGQMVSIYDGLCGNSGSLGRGIRIMPTPYGYIHFLEYFLLFKEEIRALIFL